MADALFVLAPPPPYVGTLDLTITSAASSFAMADPVVGASFATRDSLKDSINVWNYRSYAARMTSGGGGGGRSLTVRCTCRSCTILYTCRKRGGRWWIDAIAGAHISCVPSSTVALPLKVIADLSGVRAFLNLQEHHLGGKLVQNKSLVRVAGGASKVQISSWQATRLKLEHTKRIEKREADDCRAVGFFCREICAKNPGAMSFLRCYDTDTCEVLWMTCSSNPSDGVMDISGPLSLRRAAESGRRGHLNLLSMFFIPPYARAIFEMRSSTSAADFARMFNKVGVYAKTQVFLWNTEFCGTSVSLMFGQYLGNEDSEMWDYARHVSTSTFEFADEPNANQDFPLHDRSVLTHPLVYPACPTNHQLVKTYFPCTKRTNEIIITDRPFLERRKWREILGWYAFSCGKHLERNVKDAVGLRVWRKGGKECFRDLVSVVGDAAFSAAVQRMTTEFPTILKYLLESDAQQQVFNTADLLEYPWLKWSFTRYALHKQCEEFGSTLPYYALGKSPVCTNNVAEGANALEKANGVRYQAPLEWAAQKFATDNGRLQSVRSALSASKERLIPRAHAVFHAAKMDMMQDHSVRGNPGLHGFMMINNLQAGPNERLYSNVNIITRACDHPACTRVRFNRDNCKHILCGLHKTGAMERLDFFETNYPPHLLRATVLTLLETFPPYISPSLNDMDVNLALPIRRAPEPKSLPIRGRPKNNILRMPSRGEKDVDFDVYWDRGW
jgi:hypothetical protein